jgi:hypothetical protein
MKLLKTAVTALVVSVSISTAQAAPIVLDFEGAGDGARILEFYNGGTDSYGNFGSSKGVSFGPNALSLTTGNFNDNPSGRTIMFFLSGSAMLNYAAGFTTGFSFYYSSSTSALINIWDGLNGTGNLLASLNLAAQSSLNCANPNTTYCNWTAVGANFLGTARSIDFGGGVNAIGYDDITFGSATAGDTGNEVSAPATLGLLGLAMTGFAFRRRRQA